MATLEEFYQAALAEHQAGRLEVADGMYRQLLAAAPEFARAWHLLGVLSHQRGESVAGTELISRAIQLEPNRAVFYGNLGLIWRALGRLRNAETTLRQAVRLDPNFALAHVNLGLVYCDLNACHLAVDCFLAALRLSPRDLNAWRGLGYAYGELGAVQESINAYTIAFQNSGDPICRVLAATQLPLVYESTDDVRQWRQRLSDEVDRLLAEGVAIDLEKSPATPVFPLAHQGFNDRELQEKMARLYRAAPIAPVAPPLRADGKRHVAFISTFLSTHTIGKLARGLIARFPKSDFHVTVFSFSEPNDEVAREIASTADRFVVLSRELVRARDAIAAEAVDVLLYLDIGMDATTYSLAFWRLAPIQCVTWGHPLTTGLPTIDYFISSDLMETSNADSHYSEKLVRLPSLTFCYRESQLPAELRGREAFELPVDATLYACPQSIYKFHPDFDVALAEILRCDPQGRVILIRWAYDYSDELLRRRFARVMPDVCDRIHFIRRMQQPEFMNFLTLIDVALDPFPYGGGNSSLEAFSFGVPVVTLPTEFLRGRITQAFCRRLGVEDCIAGDVPNYIAIAVRLGTDQAARGSVRERLLANKHRLFNDETAVSELAKFFLRLNAS